MLSFVGLYICLTFILITATILALQHLSEISDNRIRYRILSQIGARRGYLRRQIITETVLYFYLPLVVATLHSVFAFRFFSGLIELVGLSGYLRSTTLATLVVIAVYSLYFILTVFSATQSGPTCTERRKDLNLFVCFLCASRCTKRLTIALGASGVLSHSR